MPSKKLLGGILALVLAYYLSNKSCFCRKEGRTVDTKSGSIRGIISVSRDNREYYEWLGIPYAQPPVGSLRFASPKPIGKWEGIKDARAYGHPCAHADLFTGIILGYEDCLTLNVHLPKLENAKRLLPVMVFIHGGYFMSGTSQMYRPHYFMAEEVLVVTINYRLGALGFLNTRDSNARGNMGLKDQSMALRWVKENIENFGGNPKQITIFGESAGAASVHLHMLSPMSQGLMHRAISQSGSAISMWATNDDPVGQAKSFAKKVNCPVESSEEMVKCLRNADVNDLLLVHREILDLTRTKDMFFVPTIEAIQDDETFLGEKPIDLIKAGKTAKIPLLTGFNTDEGLIFTQNVLKYPDYAKNLGSDWKLMDDVALFLPQSEKKNVDKIREYYFGKDKNVDFLQQFKAITNLFTDRWFSYGVYKAAMAHSEHAPVQFYTYNKSGPSLYDYLIMLKGDYPIVIEFLVGVTVNWFNSFFLGKDPVRHGICHADELPMMFQTPGFFNVKSSDPNYQFSKDLVKSWVSFASASNLDEVNFRGVKFPSVTPTGVQKVLEIDDTPAIIKFPIKDRMKFWASIDNTN